MLDTIISKALGSRFATYVLHSFHPRGGTRMNRATKRARARSRAAAGAHRAVRRDARHNHSLAARTIAVGGAAVCIGFIAEMNEPDAEALSLLLPMGNGNATQINILEG